MTRFWLATFAIAPSTERTTGPLAAAGTDTLAIEVLEDGDDCAVLFSSADDARNPAALTCLLGFANVAKACNIWLDRGFPLVDAAISRDAQGTLTISAPFFLCDEPVMQYDLPLLRLSGVQTGAVAPATPSSSRAALAVSYYQQLNAPDPAQPDALVTRRAVQWQPDRLKVRKLSAKYVSRIAIVSGPSPARCPSLAPLTSGTLQPRAAWSGEIRVPSRAQRRLGDRVAPQPAAHRFGVPAFRFEDVEVLGFRINLAAHGREVQRHLATLVNPLNFHLSEPTGGQGRSGLWRRARPDFRYRAATPTLIIELLRYGRMKARVPVPPLELDDSQAQHELLVRLLVGRVDDDTPQARAPAVYAPAIFVDNPWSKLLGRDALGYDKRLAEFCVVRKDTPERLRPDGRVPVTETSRAGEVPAPEPLGEIRRVNLVGRSGAGGRPLLDLDYSSTDHTDPDALRPIDLDLIFGTSSLAGVRWRQSDFDEIEFRRSFARTAVSASVRAFRSIQVAPVVERDLDRTWISGTFEVDRNVRAATPFGVATLTLRAIPRDETGSPASSAPSAWNLLCEMLGDGNTATVRLPTGSWYRLHCSMNLTIDDGLDWTTTPGT